MYNKGLFHNWVPKPVMLLLIIVLLLPILGVSGVYTGNMQDMTSSLGTLPEMMSMALNANAIGMAIAFPLILRSKQFFRSKEVMVVTLLIVAGLSIISGTTDEPVVIVVSSFFIGFFKMIALIELVLPVMFMMGPTGDRGSFNAVFYPSSIAISQLATMYSTRLSYNLQWQQVYVVSAAILVFCALLCIVFMHNLRPGKQVSFKGFDWLSMILFTTTFMGLNYVFVFAKQQGWWASESIFFVAIATIVSLVLFVYRQVFAKAPLFAFSLFKKKNVVHGLLMTLLVGMYLATAGIQNLFTTGILGYDANTNALINLAMIPGAILGGLLGYHWFKNNWQVKTYILMGFTTFALYVVCMYFLFAPVIDIEYLIIPSMLKGFGLIVLFIGLSFYTMNRLPLQQVLAAASLMIVIRSFLGTAFFGAIYSWAMYKLQWQYVGDLAVGIDVANPLVLNRGGGLALYMPVQVQAILAAAKTVFGYIIIASFAVLTYVILHRFGKINYRSIIRQSNMLAGIRIKKRKVHNQTKKEEAIAAAI